MSFCPFANLHPNPYLYISPFPSHLTYNPTSSSRISCVFLHEPKMQWNLKNRDIVMYTPL